MALDMKLALAIGVTVLGAAAVDGLSKSVGGLGSSAKKAETDAAGVGKSLDGIGAGAQKSAPLVGSIGSTLASLAGKAAAVLGISSAFSALASAGFKANASLETSKLGIASLITAQADLVGNYNRTLKGTDALAHATGIAADQMQKLKIAGLQTAATTDQLTAAYQQAVGAGLSAGLNLDQIRILTIGITQAAGALGVPMEQLNQEVVSILAGTIDVNSRVAKSLGISNEMVASWKAQGTLAKELGKRMEAFTTAGAEIAKTWAATKSNMSEAFSELSRVVTGGAFERIKAALNDALSGLFNLKDATVAQWLAPITGGMKSIFDALGSLAADSIGAALGGIKAFSEWIDKNKLSLADMGESIAESGRQFLSIAGTIGGIVISLADWLVQTGVINGALRTGALLLAGFQDGVKLIGASFASVGADILEYVVKPVEGLRGLLSGQGWGGSAFYATLQDQIKETRKAVAGVDADFAAGRTAVGKLIATWGDLGAAQEGTAKIASKSISETINVQARQLALTKEQKDLEIKLQAEKEKITLSATEFAIKEAERGAAKERLIAGSNADLLKMIEEDLRTKIKAIRDKADADRVAGESGVTKAVISEASKRVGIEQTAASAVSAAWERANAVKAAQSSTFSSDRENLSKGGAIRTNSDGGFAFVSSWDENGNYIGSLGSSSSRPVGYATGGQVAGPGTGTSDSILARLSNGEFVMQAAAVNRYGSGFMAAINNMALPKFASGGPVGDSSAPAAALGGNTYNIDKLVLPDVRDFERFISDLEERSRTKPIRINIAAAGRRNG